MLRIIGAILWLLAVVLWAMAAAQPSTQAGRWSRFCHLLATGCIILSWWVVF